MICDRGFDYDELHSFFERNDKFFMRPLALSLERFGITFDDYIRKLASLGTIAYERDSESGALKGVVIGYTNNLPEDRGSYITQVMTDGKYFRQGVCSRLLEEYKEFCISKKIPYIWLTTEFNNICAQKAYEKAGYVRVPSDSPQIVTLSGVASETRYVLVNQLQGHSLIH